MAATKAKGKKGKKPSGNIEGAKVHKGLKKAPGGKTEVAGHMSPGAVYYCWNCLAANWVGFGYSFFYCWNCGALNRV
jgi:hypothetical protein